MLGMLIGVLGTWRSLNIGLACLQSRDEFVSNSRKFVEANSVQPDAGVTVSVSDAGMHVAAPVLGDGGSVDDHGDGGMVSIPSPRPLLGAAPPPPVGERAQLLAVTEAVANAVYSRRGLLLPLVVMNLILSLLLFATCARTIRGLPSAMSGWSWVVMLSVPYQLLDCAAQLVQSREQLHAMDAVGASAALTFDLRSKLELGVQGTILATGFLVLYYVVCWLYLRWLGRATFDA